MNTSRKVVFPMITNRYKTTYRVNLSIKHFLHTDNSWYMSHI